MKTPLVASALLCVASLVSAATKPNVLVILADDLGWGELGCQGFTNDIPTPHIDSIAENGVRFTSGYVSGPYCSPTRAGFMTGRYQNRFGHEFNPGPAEEAVEQFGLSLTETTLANRLQGAGYATAWIGKSHLGYKPDFHPLKRGFDYFYGFLGGAHSYLDNDDAANPVVQGREKVPTVTYTTDQFSSEAVDFIGRSAAKPWFVYLSYNAVHGPLHATEKYLARFNSITDPRRKSFAAMLSAMDDGVGSVLGKIRELGQEENTLVIFFSDNGGPTPSTTSKNGPLRGFKSQTWEGGVRVPFMMQWKGRIPAGQTDDRPVIQLDIHPTAVAAAGVSIDPAWKLDGVNLLPFVTGENPAAPHDTLYWRFGDQMALRQGDWKLVEARDGGGRALYHLKDDIGEQTNLAASEPGRMKQMTETWNAWNATLVEPKWGQRAKKAGKGKKGKKVK
jgi:arylsulfatase A-like enzyme